jgi:iron(III) transport system substrate-binding protein
LSKTTTNSGPAQDFVSYVASRDGQMMVGSSGSYPTLPGVASPTKPEDAPTVHPDWQSLATQKATLLSDYAKIFGG